MKEEFVSDVFKFPAPDKDSATIIYNVDYAPGHRLRTGEDVKSMLFILTYCISNC